MKTEECSFKQSGGGKAKLFHITNSLTSTVFGSLGFLLILVSKYKIKTHTFSLVNRYFGKNKVTVK